MKTKSASYCSMALFPLLVLWPDCGRAQSTTDGDKFRRVELSGKVNWVRPVPYEGRDERIINLDWEQPWVLEMEITAIGDNPLGLKSGDIVHLGLSSSSLAYAYLRISEEPVPEDMYFLHMAREAKDKPWYALRLSRTYRRNTPTSEVPPLDVGEDNKN